MTNAKPQRQVTADLVRQALACIPPDIGHDDRVRIAFAVFDGIGDAGADLWLDWAGGRSEPDAAEDRAVWKSARKPGRVKVATLFGIAKEHSFKFPADGAPAAPAPSAAEQQRLAEEKRRKHQAEEEAMQARRELSARRAQVLWDGAKVDQPKAGIPYLKRKGVQAYGLRFLPGGTALVPMRDAAGRLWNVQRLLPKPLRDRDTGKEGTDKLYGPPKADPAEEVSSRKLGLWQWIGEPSGAAVLLLAEGFSTAASLHEATGRPVAVCFDAGNLVHVAKEVRALFPAPLLLMCGDDDRGTEARRGKNPGRMAAAAAALAVHSETGPAAAVFPADLADGHKDFNDLHASAGLEAVRAQIEAAILAPAAPEAPTPRQLAKSGAGGANGGADRAKQPPEPKRPATPLADQAADSSAEPSETDRHGFKLDGRGVWFVGRDKDGEKRKPQWLCDQLRVTARTRADDLNGWGYLLEFIDPDANAKT